MVENDVREIKFRLPIYTSKGKFDYWHEWGFIHEGKGLLVFKGCTESPALAQEHSQQYLNIKDKNNKPVYQGDIIKIDRGELGTTKDQVAVIEWDGGLGWQIECFPEAASYNLADLTWGSFTVIGNVVENPELIPED